MMSFLEKMLQLFEIQALKPDEVRWYHEWFYDYRYDEDTDLVYLMGLNMIPCILMIVVIAIMFFIIQTIAG